MNICKIRVESFEVYGLNKYKDFLEGDELNMDSAEDVIEWACNVLNEDPSESNMAVFIQASNDALYAVTKEVCEEYVDIFKYVIQDDLDYFAKLDAELNFSKYGLIMQVGKTTWRIIHF